MAFEKVVCVRACVRVCMHDTKIIVSDESMLLNAIRKLIVIRVITELVVLMGYIDLWVP